MILSYFIFLSIISTCLGSSSIDRNELKTDKCNEQSCYIPKKCPEQSVPRGRRSKEYPSSTPESELHELLLVENGGPFSCDFWFTLNPFSASKVLVRTSSKHDLEANFDSGRNFFSCKNASGKAMANSEVHNIVVRKTSTDDDWLYCEFFLTIKSGNDEIIPEVKPNEEKSAVKEQTYEKEADEKPKNEKGGDANSKFEVTSEKPESKKEDTSKEKEGNKMTVIHGKNNYQFDQGQTKKHLNEKVTCDKDSITSLVDKNEDYQYTDAITDYRSVECADNKDKLIVFHPKINGWNESKTVTSIECREDTAGTWNYTVSETQLPPIKTPFNVSCQKELKDCKNTLNIVCDEKACNETLKKNSVECPPGFNIIVIEEGSRQGIDSIKCDRSTGEWIRSDGKIISSNGTFHCSKESINDQTTISTVVIVSKAEAKADWVLIGLCTAGGIILLILFMAALWCVCARKRKTPEEPPAPPPPVTLPSQPPSLPSPAPSPLRTPTPSTPQPVVHQIVVIVKHEEGDKKEVAVKMDQDCPDEKSFAALSQTGEKERARQKSRTDKEKSEVEQKDTSDVQMRLKSVVERKNDDNDSKSFTEAYNKELDKKLGDDKKM